MSTGGLSRRDFLGWLGAVGIGAAAPLDARAVPTEVVLCRDAWGALPPRGRFRRHEIRRITVHHSGVALLANGLAPTRFRTHQRVHRARGWPDIAYHLLVDRRGHVYEGRPRWAVGDTSTDYDPRGHLLILCEGHFDQQHPSAAQLRSLVALLAWAVRRYAVPVPAVRGHRDYVATACPGDALQERLPEIRRRVRAATAGDLARLCGAAGRARVRAIEAGRR